MPVGNPVTPFVARKLVELVRQVIKVGWVAIHPAGPSFMQRLGMLRRVTAPVSPIHRDPERPLPIKIPTFSSRVSCAVVATASALASSQVPN